MAVKKKTMREEIVKPIVDWMNEADASEMVNLYNYLFGTRLDCKTDVECDEYTMVELEEYGRR
jgi:hypothetical protein